MRKYTLLLVFTLFSLLTSSCSNGKRGLPLQIDLPEGWKLAESTVST